MFFTSKNVKLTLMFFFKNGKMNNDDDNFLKKLFRRRFWLGHFILTPLIVYIAILGITNSSELAIILAIMSFVIWTIIFFIKGIYKEIL